MIIGHQVLVSKAIPYFEGLPCSSLYFCVDDACYYSIPTEFASFMGRYPTLRLQIDSANKSINLLTSIWQWLAEQQAKRNSTLIIIGGGTMTDIAGFAAATYMRGISTVNITTTLLGMVDASVGGKTAIDFSGIKNIIGAFHEPQEVFIDTCFLDTLPINELYSGFGEVIKTALLSGEQLWHNVLQCDPQILSHSEWVDLITQCISYKTSIVSQDPKEDTGLRAVLNLGHTIGHALETFSRETGVEYPLLHGEAVVIGLIVECYLAVKHIGLDKQILRQLLTLVREHYPHYQYVCKAYPRLLQLMYSDKKNTKSSIITFSLLRKLGHAETWQCSDNSLIEEALDFYREAFGG